MLVPDSAYFVFGLLGLFAGYIVGDFQRELRWRRDAKRNLALAVERLPGAHDDASTEPHPVTVLRSGFDNVPVSRAGAHSDGDPDGAAWSLGSVRDGQARRAAVSRPNHRDGSTASVRGGSVRRSTPTPVRAGYDCG